MVDDGEKVLEGNEEGFPVVLVAVVGAGGVVVGVLYVADQIPEGNERILEWNSGEISTNLMI